MNALFSWPHSVLRSRMKKTAGSEMRRLMREPATRAASAISGMTMPPMKLNGAGAKGAIIRTASMDILAQCSKASKSVIARTRTKSHAKSGDW
ncbi:Uncharacterised protein [Candidatus Burarchaeum australiense]|nr:Uncharacterised protein [Candidatus Burarchaeum australiense]